LAARRDHVGQRVGRDVAIVVAVGVLFGIGIYIYAHRDYGSLEKTKRQGQELVEALRAYRADHGAYPEALEALVPGYLPKLEPPAWGLGVWRYRRLVAEEGRAEEQFFLAAPANETGFPLLFYDAADGRWVQS
jgi:hypothetical protein